MTGQSGAAPKNMPDKGSCWYLGLLPLLLLLLLLLLLPVLLPLLLHPAAMDSRNSPACSGRSSCCHGWRQKVSARKRLWGVAGKRGS
jgi:hypothetical protein